MAISPKKDKKVLSAARFDKIISLRREHNLQLWASTLLDPRILVSYRPALGARSRILHRSSLWREKSGASLKKGRLLGLQIRLFAFTRCSYVPFKKHRSRGGEIRGGYAKKFAGRIQSWNRWAPALNTGATPTWMFFPQLTVQRQGGSFIVSLFVLFGMTRQARRAWGTESRTRASQFSFLLAPD